MSFANMKIISKVLIVIGVLAIASLGGAAYSGYKMNVINDGYSRILNEDEMVLSLMERDDSTTNAMNGDIWAAIALSDEAAVKDSLKDFDQISAGILADLDQGIKNYPRYADVLKKLRDLTQSEVDAAKPIGAAALAMQNELAMKQMPPFTKANNDISDMVAEALVKQTKYVANASQAATDETWHTIYLSMGLIFGCIGVVVAGSIFLVRTQISKPIAGVIGCLNELANNNLSVAVDGVERRDEVGDIAKTAQVFKESLVEAESLRNAQRLEQEKQIERARKLEEAVTAFDQMIGEVVGVVSSSATELQATAQSLSSTAEETTHQSNAVSNVSEKMSHDVQTVASATEELSSSIREIGNQVTESTRIVSNAVQQTEETNAKVKDLSEAAQKIGTVVTLINEIASQTNLLALNATIEAARAGNAGKGFAVVASEVKNLASQTARATDEIASQVRAIQDSTDTSAAAIQGISQTIARVNEIATAIASAVEEQGAATQEISRSVQQAAAGTHEVANNIVGVTQASQQTSAGATQVLSAANELAQNGDRLKSEVSSFLQTVRSL
ncbi:MAG TPA: methyl-accepting chemotaxis protein [Terriglobales bacterium]|nr:methyl-accepting chemotaxis protein [Terriglobales bacterium]